MCIIANFFHLDNESSNKISVLFLLRLNRKSKKKGIPIVCRITVNGSRCPEFYTNVFVKNEGDFDAQTETTKDKEKDKILLVKRAEIEKLASQYEIANQIVTADEFYFAYDPNAKKNLGKKKPKMVFEIYNEFLKLTEDRAKSGIIEIASLKKQQTFRNNLKKYFESLGIKDLEISKILRVDYEKIKVFFMGDLKFSNNHTLKNLSGYKSLLKFAVDSNYLEKNPFNNCSMKKTPPKKIRLSIDELERMEKKVFSTERIQGIADCFVFCCYTGLAYADLEKYHISMVTTEEGREVINLKRHKTDVGTYIPLFKGAKRILQKYQNILPVRTNQKHNEYLKEIANILEINKNLTTHVARKTFAYLMLNVEKVPYETVSKMLAHASLKTLIEHYADVELERILHDTKHIE